MKYSYFCNVKKLQKYEYFISKLQPYIQRNIYTNITNWKELIIRYTVSNHLRETLHSANLKWKPQMEQTLSTYSSIFLYFFKPQQWLAKTNHVIYFGQSLLLFWLKKNEEGINSIAQVLEWNSKKLNIWLRSQIRKKHIRYLWKIYEGKIMITSNFCKKIL